MKNFKFKIKNYNQGGYAMLYTVVIISIIMSISIGLSNSIAKAFVLASVAKDSQIAFYQADIATECGLYLQFKKGTAIAFHGPSGGSGTFLCGLDSFGQPIEFDVTSPSNKVYDLTPVGISSGPCFSIHIDDTLTTPNRLIQARGYNQCDAGAENRVERALDVYY